MNFQKIDFPIEARAPIEANGGVCVAAWECIHGNNYVGVLLAEEPVGLNGADALHLRVSASTACIRRFPSDQEIKEALKASGIDPNNAGLLVRNNVVHIFKAKP